MLVDNNGDRLSIPGMMVGLQVCGCGGMDLGGILHLLYVIQQKIKKQIIKLSFKIMVEIRLLWQVYS